MLGQVDKIKRAENVVFGDPFQRHTLFRRPCRQLRHLRTSRDRTVSHIAHISVEPHLGFVDQTNRRLC